MFKATIYCSRIWIFRRNSPKWQGTTRSIRSRQTKNVSSIIQMAQGQLFRGIPSMDSYKGKQWLPVLILQTRLGAAHFRGECSPLRTSGQLSSRGAYPKEKPKETERKIKPGLNIVLYYSHFIMELRYLVHWIVPVDSVMWTTILALLSSLIHKNIILMSIVELQLILLTLFN